MKDGKKRLTLDLTSDEYRDLDEVLRQTTSTMSKADIIRRSVKIFISLKKGELFLSTSADCQNKIPASIL